MPLSYWWSLTKGTARYYAKRRRWKALIVALLTTWVFRDNGERCQECGSRYHGTVWMAPDDLYERVHGNGGGTLCPACFDKAAAAKGVRLMWTCFVWDVGGCDIKDRINGSRWDGGGVMCDCLVRHGS